MLLLAACAGAATTASAGAGAGSIEPASAAGLAITSGGLTVYRTCTLSGTPDMPPAVADSTVRQATPAGLFGGSPTLTVSSARGANQRAYVSFDLGRCVPAIPAGALVTLATLRLSIVDLAGNCRTIDVFPVPAGWNDSALAWNNQPFGTTLNSPASGAATASFQVGSPSSCASHTIGAYVAAPVTDDVAAFVAGAAPDFGWMLRDDAEDSAATRLVAFGARELGSTAQAPQLVITYVAQP